MVNERLARTCGHAVGLRASSYHEVACSLHTCEPTITTRLYRGRRHVASAPISGAEALPNPALDIAALLRLLRRCRSPRD